MERRESRSSGVDGSSGAVLIVLRFSCLWLCFVFPLFDCSVSMLTVLVVSWTFKIWKVK